MKMIKTFLFLTVAITTLTPDPTYSQPGPLKQNPSTTKSAPGPFLPQLKVGTTIDSPRKALPCGQDNRACGKGGREGICCKNRCVEMGSDASNCGACSKKCSFGKVCCMGKCVNLDSDGRHCGFCNNMCEIHGACVYGICDYAL